VAAKRSMTRLFLQPTLWNWCIFAIYCRILYLFTQLTSYMISRNYRQSGAGMNFKVEARVVSLHFWL